ncbi:hypothetical protein HMPREF1318_1068 [Actinomyces massiliensis F0489]|uniref:Uncharacterized protein n=1 Tax=Actinomyces massiliensis F0489 TaxID=1125718 RepID=J1H0B6_9ACTO|nr:hypothetical protein HMPREF1318_1068 [Actinomyces massiliensis F0489]
MSEKIFIYSAGEVSPHLFGAHELAYLSFLGDMLFLPF